MRKEQMISCTKGRIFCIFLYSITSPDGRTGILLLNNQPCPSGINRFNDSFKNSCTSLNDDLVFHKIPPWFVRLQIIYIFRNSSLILKIKY